MVNPKLKESISAIRFNSQVTLSSIVGHASMYDKYDMQ